MSMLKNFSFMMLLGLALPLAWAEDEFSSTVLANEEITEPRLSLDYPNPWDDPWNGGRNVVRYRVNQTQGPYAPSCNGNPVYPQPDQRCCQFGYNALCFTYSVGCNAGERMVQANLRCQGYTRSGYAVEVGGRWGGGGRGQSQFACEKLDGARGYVTLAGTVTCERRRPGW